MQRQIFVCCINAEKVWVKDSDARIAMYRSLLAIRYVVDSRLIFSFNEISYSSVSEASKCLAISTLTIERIKSLSLGKNCGICREKICRYLGNSVGDHCFLCSVLVIIDFCVVCW